MEKIHCICVMRDVMRALAELENQLLANYGVSLYEAMVLCSIGQETVPASLISQRTGLSASHTSKVIRSAETKGLLQRHLGETDKRQMFFNLTPQATHCLEHIKQQGVEIPSLLQPLFGM